jgi:hypothetical protein
LKRIVSRIKLSRKTEDEKKKIKGDIEERIKTLRHNIKQVGFNIVNFNMNASFSFDLYMVYGRQVMAKVHIAFGKVS